MVFVGNYFIHETSFANTFLAPVAGVLGALAGGFAGACGHSLVSMIGQTIASLF